VHSRPSGHIPHSGAGRTPAPLTRVARFPVSSRLKVRPEPATATGCIRSRFIYRHCMRTRILRAQTAPRQLLEGVPRFPDRGRTRTSGSRILGTESIRETINAAFREVIRIAAVRDLVALGEAGAFEFLLEPGAEEQMWG
jgi:hypothetical protein